MSASHFTVFMLLEALPSWLSLERAERNSIAEKAMTESLLGLRVRHRHYDAEAFSGRCSDVAVFETEDLRDYYFAIERLRDSPIFARPYFRVVDIIPAIGDGFRDFEESEAGHAA